MDRGARLPRGGQENAACLLADGIGEPDVRRDPLAEERRGPADGAVDELIGDDHLARMDRSFIEPTAEAERIRSTPSAFIA